MHGPILNLLFPNANDGALILQISSLQIIFTILEQTVNGALQGIGRIYLPAISLTIGVVIKIILNSVLVPISGIGAVGAAIATTVCHAVAFIIGYKVLKKNIKLYLPFSKFFIKPFIAVFIMSVCSYVLYLVLNNINLGKIATLITILFAMAIYIFSIFILKILTKNEILMLPYGIKMYKILKRIGIYKEAKT